MKNCESEEKQDALPITPSPDSVKPLAVPRLKLEINTNLDEGELSGQGSSARGAKKKKKKKKRNYEILDQEEDAVQNEIEKVK